MSRINLNIEAGPKQLSKQSGLLDLLELNYWRSADHDTLLCANIEDGVGPALEMYMRAHQILQVHGC